MKENRKSASKWYAASESALLKLWNKKMVDLRGCRKNSHILLEMVAELQNQGFAYTFSELKTKMHNMTARYRREKRMVAFSGGSPSKWELYNEMEMLLAAYQSYNSGGLVVDSMNHINSTIVYVPSSTSPLPSVSMQYPPLLAAPTVVLESPPTAPSAGMNEREEFENFFKNMETKVDCLQEYIKQTSEKLLQIEEEKKDILKAYVDREAEVQQALIQYLKRQ